MTHHTITDKEKRSLLRYAKEVEAILCAVYGHESKSLNATTDGYYTVRKGRPLLTTGKQKLVIKTKNFDTAVFNYNNL